MFSVMTADEDNNCKWYGPFDRSGAFTFVGEMATDTKEPMEYYIYELSLIWSNP